MPTSTIHYPQQERITKRDRRSMQCNSLLPKPAVIRCCLVLEYPVSEQHVYLIVRSSVALIHISPSLLRSFPSLPTPTHLLSSKHVLTLVFTLLCCSCCRHRLPPYSYCIRSTHTSICRILLSLQYLVLVRDPTVVSNYIDASCNRLFAAHSKARICHAAGAVKLPSQFDSCLMGK
jgi:hypothetical protein